MLAKFFYGDIIIFTTTDWSWAGFALIGLLLGLFLRLYAVRRKSEFKGTFTGLVIIWFVLHISSYISETGTAAGLPILLLSAVASLSPVSTFMIIGFLLTHMVKKVKDE